MQRKIFHLCKPPPLSKLVKISIFSRGKNNVSKTGRNDIRSLKEKVAKKDKPGGGGSKPKVPFINTFFSTLKGSLIKEMHQYLKSSDKSLTHNIQVKVLQYYQSGVCVYCSQIRLDVERGRKRH